MGSEFVAAYLEKEVLLAVLNGAAAKQLSGYS